MTNRISEKRTRGGFTLAEVVVALAVIVIVTAAAMTLISSQLSLEVQTVQTVEAANIAENAIECFRFAKKNSGATTFEEVYKAVYGIVNFENYQNGEGENKTSFTQTLNGTTYKVIYKITDNEILVEVYVGENTSPIISQDYTYRPAP